MAPENIPSTQKTKNPKIDYTYSPERSKAIIILLRPIVGRRLEEEDVPDGEDSVEDPVVEHIVEGPLHRNAALVQDMDELALQLSFDEVEDSQNCSVPKNRDFRGFLKM